MRLCQPTGHVLLPLDRHRPALVAFVSRLVMVSLAYIGAWARRAACYSVL